MGLVIIYVGNFVFCQIFCLLVFLDFQVYFYFVGLVYVWGYVCLFVEYYCG